MYLQLIIGFLLLFGGAEMLVRGAVQVATRLGVSTLLIGMTVVALGTSAPEFVVSLDAALAGSPGIALGNVVGSNITNILLVLGATCLIFPVMVDPKALMRDTVMLMGSSLLFAWFALSGEIGVLEGLFMVALLSGYFLYSYISERRESSASSRLHEREADEFRGIKISALQSWLFFGLGLAGVIIGADQLVIGGTAIAREHGVAEEVIGLTLVAFGTSLPELAASVMAAFRGHTDVAIGTVIGSNLFNLLFVTGGVAMVSPLAVPLQIQTFDIWVMLAVTMGMVAYLALGMRFRKPEGFALVALYGAYVALQVYGVEVFLG